VNPADTRTLLQTLRASTHRYIGIRPADATPTEAPCIVLQERTANDLAYACTTAGQVWPECQGWALIGSDEQLVRNDPTWPPTMHALRMPVTLATFRTTA
jgi:hypothetical protein